MSDTSVEFGILEFLKKWYHFPILNSIQDKLDKYPSFSYVPRRQRSKRRFRTEKKTAVKDTRNREGRSIVLKSESECIVWTNPHAGASNSEVCKRSLSCVRRSRRLHHRNADGQTLGKLDSEKFEIYMETLWRRFADEKNNSFTYFDSLWFYMYTEGPRKAKVLSWIKKKDIFSKKYVFVPIVQWGHWFLLIFCNFGEDLQSNIEGRCMLLLDSLREANTSQLEPRIRRFVSDIFQTEERPEKEHLIRNIPLLVPKVPQQIIGHECGFYVLYYIYLFLKSAPDNLTFSMGYPHFMKEDWFTPEDVEHFVKTLDSMNKSSNCSN
ncbi:hypothetical protein ACS0TY_019446 [Phlomoides rotata]